MTKNTIEERILRRAQQKQNVQKTVYSGEVFKANNFSSNEVVNLFFDEDELSERKNNLKIINETKKKKEKAIKVLNKEINGNGVIKVNGKIKEEKPSK